MTAIVGKIGQGIASSVSYMMPELNKATLSGAVDIMVVEQPDGSFKLHPFGIISLRCASLHSCRRACLCICGSQKLPRCRLAVSQRTCQ